ncbi:hypothetical protein G7046_g6564 [Stylonectria norvegica]|nr:hypothetical protein G7046_g6564 [Stylonectria norvegica]
MVPHTLISVLVSQVSLLLFAQPLVDAHPLIAARQMRVDLTKGSIPTRPLIPTWYTPGVPFTVSQTKSSQQKSADKTATEPIPSIPTPDNFSHKSAETHHARSHVFDSIPGIHADPPKPTSESTQKPAEIHHTRSHHFDSLPGFHVNPPKPTETSSVKSDEASSVNSDQPQPTEQRLHGINLDMVDGLLLVPDKESNTHSKRRLRVDPETYYLYNRLPSQPEMVSKLLAWDGGATPTGPSKIDLFIENGHGPQVTRAPDSKRDAEAEIMDRELRTTLTTVNTSIWRPGPWEYTYPASKLIQTITYDDADKTKTTSCTSAWSWSATGPPWV